MSYNVLTTDTFAKKLKKLAKKYPAIKEDIRDFSKKIDEFVASGTPLGKDCHKVRMQITGKNSGKSGGARVILHVQVVNNTIYLLTIYDKGDQQTVTDKEIEKLLKEIK